MPKFKDLSVSARSRGFTLVELLIVIAIIAILAVVGVAVFRGVTNASRDAKRRADLEAIAKAYEIKYSSVGSYQALANTDFAAGAIPKTPEGNNYPCLVGPESNCTVSATDKVAYCVSLGDNQSAPCYSSSNTCYCSSSTQGSSLSGGGGSGGGGSNPSCDPYGVLTSGLVGYWKMDETSWVNDCASNTAIDSVGNLYPGKSCPAGTGPLGGATGKLGKAGSFDSINDYIKLPNIGIPPSQTVSGWFNYVAAPATNYISIITNWWGSYGKIGINSTGRFYWGWIDSGNVSHSITSSSAISSGTWHLFTAAYDKSSTTATLYIDGIQAGTAGSPNMERSGNSFIIGHDQARLSGYNEGWPFNGLLDDIRFYNRSLSAPEVSTLYNSGNGCVP